MKRKILFYGFAYLHHLNSQGGYHHLREYLKYDISISIQKQKMFFDYTLRKNVFLKVLKRCYFIFFNQIGVLELIRCIIIGTFKKNIVFHFIYPENSFAWLHFFIADSNKIVFTLHQPKEFFINNHRWINILKSVDKIILLDKNDISYFSNLTGKSNVYYIPHGINTDFFKIDNSIQKACRVLMVGNWLRDFEFASKIFFKLNQIFGSNIDIVVVTDTDNYKFFNGCNVRLLSNISDQELLFLYQSSSVVYYPLVDFTANNSLLEAASCGCNILVSTDKDFNWTYFPDDLISYVKCDEDFVINKIIDLIESNGNKELAFKLAEFTKSRYSWQVVSNSTYKVLSSEI